MAQILEFERDIFALENQFRDLVSMSHMYDSVGDITHEIAKLKKNEQSSECDFIVLIKVRVQKSREFSARLGCCFIFCKAEFSYLTVRLFCQNSEPFIFPLSHFLC